MNDKSVVKLLLGLFWIAVTLFLGGLVVLSFFNHATADDYFALYNEQKFGFIGFQKFIYMHWGGRYFSSLIAAIFSANGYLVHHYYVHTILLIVFTLIASYIFVSVISRYLINKAIVKRERIMLAALLTILQFVIYPELSTALYWFSSAVTYQISVILLMLLVATTIKILQEKSSKTTALLFFFLILLVLACNGSNEVSAIFSGVLMLIILILYKKKFNAHLGKIIVLALIYVLSIIALIIAPGNRERMTVLEGKDVNIVLSVISSFYRVFVVYWNLFLSPLFWVSMASFFLYAIYIRDRIFILRHHKTNLKTIVLFITIWTIVLLIVLIPILLLSNGSIPDRALNVLSAFTLLVFIMVSFYMGLCIMDKNVKQLLAHQQLRITVATVLIICIVTNNTSREIAGSLISAGTYHRAMLQRTQILNEASINRKDTVQLTTIDNAMLNDVNTYSAGKKAMLKEWMKKKPLLLFISDDMATPESRKVLADYYKVKILSVK